MTTAESSVQDRVEALASQYRDEYGSWPSARMVTEMVIRVLVDAGWTGPLGLDLTAVDEQPPEPRQLRVVQATELVPASVLDMFGGWLQVRRFTEHTPAERVGEVRAEIPCCTKGFHEAAGRKVVLRTDVDEQPPVVCPSCRLQWRVELEPEVDGGLVAVFELVGEVTLASAQRKYKDPL